MAPDEQAPKPPAPRAAWLLPPLGVLAALALAVGAGALFRGRAGPPPAAVDLAPVATGTHPFAHLARSLDGDWCALVTSAAREPALQCYFVQRTQDEKGEHLLVEASLVDRRGDEWLADAIGATQLATTGEVSSATETRTVGGRAFECRVLTALLPATTAEEPARRTTVWLSSSVKSLGVVAARVELLGLRRDILDWELAGYGSRGKQLPLAEWGRPPLELAHGLASLHVR